MSAMSRLRSCRMPALSSALRQGSTAWLRGAGAAVIDSTAPAATLATAQPVTVRWPPSLRGFHSSSPRDASLQVKVPPLGESISDGVVAAVLKQPGDAVEEDEPILQLETDKVTVDVRAPRAGVIEAILVAEGATIAVGHVIASIVEGAQAGTAEGTPPKAATQGAPTPPANPAPAAEAEAASPPPPPPQASAPAAPAAPERPAGHAHISFPPRRTPAGEAISMLQAAEATAALQAARAAAAGPPQPTAEQQFLMRMAAPPRSRPPPVPIRQLSEDEMERIMLGGAEP